MGDRWGPEGPPDEAYSRVTNPERFEPLIPYAEQLLDGLERTFVVTREEGYDLVVSHWSSPKKLSRASMRLLPSAEEAAPIVVAFSSYPGISVLAGHWYETNFPHCGCDACDETAAGGQAELTELVDAVVSGRIREYVDLPLIGDGWLGNAQWSSGGNSSGKSRITRKQARKLIAAADGRRKIEYGPWPQREGVG